MGNLNSAELLPGTVWGSTPTAAHTATPTIRIYGDGGAATYACKLDGQDIGQFKTTSPYGYVDVFLSTPLSDAGHVLEYDELSPRPQGPDGWSPSAKTPKQFNFSVDTKAPDVPVITTVAVYGPDANGRYQIRASGTCAKDVNNVQLRVGPASIGGGGSFGSGVWNASSTPQLPGAIPLQAVAIDYSGNRSDLTPVYPVQAGPSTAPIAPNAPVASVKPTAITVNWTKPSDGGSPITGYRVYRGGVKIADVSATASSYTDTSPDGTGYTVSAVNAVGEGAKSSPVMP